MGSTKGFINVRDKDNNIFMISKEDPRYISGELKHISAGVFKYFNPITLETFYMHESLALEKGYLRASKKLK